MYGERERVLREREREVRVMFAFGVVQFSVCSQPKIKQKHKFNNKKKLFMMCVTCQWSLKCVCGCICISPDNIIISYDQMSNTQTNVM